MRRRTTGTALPPPKPVVKAQPRRTQLTSRAVVLGLLICAMTLALTYPLRQFVRQRGEVADLRLQLRRQEQQVTDLEARRRQLADPAYVEKLARERLHFVRPGEVGYIAIPPTPAPAPTRVGGAGSSLVAPDVAEGSWYARLWSTVEGAGQPPKPAASATPAP